VHEKEGGADNRNPTANYHVIHGHFANKQNFHSNMAMWQEETEGDDHDLRVTDSKGTHYHVCFFLLYFIFQNFFNPCGFLVSLLYNVRTAAPFCKGKPCLLVQMSIIFVHNLQHRLSG